MIYDEDDPTFGPPRQETLFPDRGFLCGVLVGVLLTAVLLIVLMKGV